MGDEAPIVVTTLYDPSDGTGESTAGLAKWPDLTAVLAELNAVIGELGTAFDARVADACWWEALATD